MKAIVLTSGGLDSAVCLAEAVHKYGKGEVIALNMYYGQRHSKECAAAKALAGYYDVLYLERDLSDVFMASHDALLEQGAEIPKGSYQEQIKKDGEPKTAVPFRNGVFLSVATSMALQYECNEVWTGIHQGDEQATYNDCKESFLDYLNLAVYEGTGGKVSLFVPFIDKTKTNVVLHGESLKVPFGITWSCYEGGEKPCGKCGTCIERTEAFSQAGLIDPLTIDA